jgi:hypothetical protein
MKLEMLDNAHNNSCVYCYKSSSEAWRKIGCSSFVYLEACLHLYLLLPTTFHCFCYCRGTAMGKKSTASCFQSSLWHLWQRLQPSDISGIAQKLAQRSHDMSLLSRGFQSHLQHEEAHPVCSWKRRLEYNSYICIRDHYWCKAFIINVCIQRGSFLRLRPYCC